MLCVAAAGAVLALAADRFTLEWTHSVTLTQWQESWVVDADGVRPVEATIQGPGAGMELPEGAWPVPGGWRYRVSLPPQRVVVLASSGATPSGWRLCANGTCHDLGTTEGTPLRLWSGEGCAAP